MTKERRNASLSMYIWAKADVVNGGVAWDMWIMFLCFMSVICIQLQTAESSN